MPTSGNASGREGDSNNTSKITVNAAPSNNSPNTATTATTKPDLNPPTLAPLPNTSSTSASPAASATGASATNASQGTAAASKSGTSSSSSSSATSSNSNSNNQLISTAAASSVASSLLPNTASSFSLTDASSIPTSNNSSSSGGKNNTIIFGSVVGLLAALAVLGLIVSRIMRRQRRNRLIVDEVRAIEPPPNLEKPDFNRASTFDPMPPGMPQLHRYDSTSRSLGSVPTSSSAYSSYNNVRGPQPYASDPGYGGAISSPYGSQPQPQYAYTAEPYGPYGHPSNAGNFSVPAPAYPNPRSPLARPTRRDSGPIPVSLVPGTAGSRGPSSLSIYDDRDAYGGF